MLERAIVFEAGAVLQLYFNFNWIKANLSVPWTRVFWRYDPRPCMWFSVLWKEHEEWGQCGGSEDICNIHCKLVCTYIYRLSVIQITTTTKATSSSTSTRQFPSLSSSRRYCCSRLLFHETLLWIFQGLPELLCLQPQDAAQRPHTLQSSFVCPSASQFCSALHQLQSAVLRLHLVSFSRPAASPVVVWSHIITMG